MKTKANHINKLAEYVTPKVYIVGGTYITTPEVEGFNRLDNFLKTQRVNNINALRNAVVKQIKDKSRNWQFWFVIFDFKGSEYEITTFLTDPIFGDSQLVDKVTNEELTKHISERDAENKEFTIGWVAIPSVLVDVDDATEEQFINLFKAKGFHSKEKYDGLKIMTAVNKVG
jgi:hypothetical protein